ncbi:hypothetical protein ID866_11531 [Astraeus odoratus]|nr:hypothetical protein ID866_11531 [Astraeus odoratus]
MAVPAGPNLVAGPPVHSAPPGQKLPPHLTALNPAVTKITYIPYTVSKSAELTEDAEEDKKSDKSPLSEGYESKDTKLTVVKVEDPVSVLTPVEITTLRDVMPLSVFAIPACITATWVMHYLATHDMLQPYLSQWPTVFNALFIISNRQAPLH